MSTLTTATSAADRIRAAAYHALELDERLRVEVIVHVFGAMTAAADILERGDHVSACRLADMLDQAVGDAIGRSLQVGDRVTLEVNDLGGTVTGAVAKVYDQSVGDAISLDVLLPDGRIFPQSARFVKPVRR